MEISLIKNIFNIYIFFLQFIEYGMQMRIIFLFMHLCERNYTSVINKNLTSLRNTL